LPHQYRVPDFSKFSGSDDISTIEHIGQFLTQCGEATTEEQLLVRFLPLSLSRPASEVIDGLVSVSNRSCTSLHSGQAQ
jgi:hypothetical protein